MRTIVDFPLVVFAFSFAALWFSALVGAFFRDRVKPLGEDEREDFGVIQGAALTLLSLLIGFTFSMAGNRYEQRKTCEEAEANAIEAEYVRADLLPAEDAVKVRELLRSYLDQRVLFYTTQDQEKLRQIDHDTAQLESDLWSTIRGRALTQPTPMVAIATSGMSEVLNSRGYTQSAWWNRIPLDAWVLLTGIAVGCNLLIGYGARRTSKLFIVLPLAVSISFFLIADIDSPRRGVIRIEPRNLLTLSQTLHPH